LEQVVEGALVGGELVWGKAEQGTLDREKGMRMIGVPVEDSGGGFSNGMEGLVLVEEFCSRQRAEGFGSSKGGLGEVDFGFAVGLTVKVFTSSDGALGASEHFLGNDGLFTAAV